MLNDSSWQPRHWKCGCGDSFEIPKERRGKTPGKCDSCTAKDRERPLVWKHGFSPGERLKLSRELKNLLEINRIIEEDMDRGTGVTPTDIQREAIQARISRLYLVLFGSEGDLLVQGVEGGCDG